MQNTSRSRLWPSIFPRWSPETKSSPGTILFAQLRVTHFIPEDFKRKQNWRFLTKLELSLRHFTKFWFTAPRPARPGALMAGVFIARTPTFFFLLSPSIESFVRRQLCKSPFYGNHEYPLAPSLLMSCCWICTMCTLLEQQYSSRSLVQCARLNRWTSTLRLTVESATTRPGFRSAAKLLSRERSESCLVCALRKIQTCLWVSPFRVQFRRPALSDRRARTTMATETVERRLEQLMGHFCEIMRQRKEKGLQSKTWEYLRRWKTK